MNKEGIKEIFSDIANLASDMVDAEDRDSRLMIMLKVRHLMSDVSAAVVRLRGEYDRAKRADRKRKAQYRKMFKNVIDATEENN